MDRPDPPKSQLHVMMARWAAPGQVRWIGLRPDRRVALSAVAQAQIAPDGLIGDRARAGKRAVTLIQAEHLPVIQAMLRGQDVTPGRLRRNIVVSGLNLAALKGRAVRIGQAVVRITTICAPCSRMEAEFGHGGYSALRGHGGWCAEVVTPGLIGVGAAVQPID